MRLTLRRRAALAVLLSWPVALVYLVVAAHLVYELLLASRGISYDCSGGVLQPLDSFNRCGSGYSVLSTVVELLLGTALAALIIWALARWIAWPLRELARSVARLGPTSLGLRLGQGGPADETRELIDAIDALLDRVAQGYEAQRRFAANASHELRTPLATQRALIEVSLRTALDPAQVDLLSRQLLATNERNESLIEGLLVLAETDRGPATRAAQRLDLLTAAVLETLRPGAVERGLRLSAVLDPVAVAGEAALLERLITNLIQNAIKYNVDGGWVAIEVRAEGRMTVANSGPVVAPEAVAGLFEPFRRGRGDRLDHAGGVGLGLTIVRSVAAAHGGRVAAQANREGGLRVVVDLAVAAAALTSTAGTTAPATASITAGGGTTAAATATATGWA